MWDAIRIGREAAARRAGPLKKKVGGGDRPREAIFRDRLSCGMEIQRVLDQVCGKRCAHECRRVMNDRNIIFALRKETVGPPGAPMELRRQHCCELVRAARDTSVPAGVVRFLWQINMTQVCRKAWMFCHGVTHAMVERQIGLMRRGLTVPIIPNARVTTGVDHVSSIPAKEAMAWLRGFATLCGQMMPDERVWRLPFRHKKIVWEAFCGEMVRSDKGRYIGEMRFYQVWKRQHCEIKMARKRGDFAQCDTCSLHAVQLAKERDPDTAQNIKRDWAAHLIIMNRCRNKYYDHRAKAANLSHKYLSIIIDAIEKRKCMLPYLLGKTHRMDANMQLLQALYGSKVHGVGNFGFFYDPKVGATGETLCICLR